MEKLLAYHGDQAIKAKYMARVEAHRKADELVQGTGFENGRGCAVGCTFDDYGHSRGPVEIGYPEELMHLEDAIFEGLPKAKAMEWPTRFLAAAEPGADLSLVWPKFAIWLLSAERYGELFSDGKHADCYAAMVGVRSLFAEWVSTGKKPSRDQWYAAGYAARAAWAAWDAAGDAAGDAAWDAFWQSAANELERLIRDAK